MKIINKTSKTLKVTIYRPTDPVYTFVLDTISIRAHSSDIWSSSTWKGVQIKVWEPKFFDSLIDGPRTVDIRANVTLSGSGGISKVEIPPDPPEVVAHGHLQKQIGLLDDIFNDLDNMLNSVIWSQISPHLISAAANKQVGGNVVMQMNQLRNSTSLGAASKKVAAVTNSPEQLFKSLSISFGASASALISGNALVGIAFSLEKNPSRPVVGIASAAYGLSGISFSLDFYFQLHTKSTASLAGDFLSVAFAVHEFWGGGATVALGNNPFTGKLSSIGLLGGWGGGGVPFIPAARKGSSTIFP